MIDPTTEWIIYKHMERERMLEIELRQRRAMEGRHVLAQPWYSQVTKWLSQVARHFAPGKQGAGTALSAPACCPADMRCCSCG